jgi:hypothetical protein
MKIEHRNEAELILERAELALVNKEATGPALDDAWQRLRQVCSAFVVDHPEPTLVRNCKPSNPKTWENIRDISEMLLTAGMRI